MIVFPNAKINIGLYVLGVRPDGLHDLETVFFPIPLRDTLEITPLKMSNSPWELITAGIPVSGHAEDNLVVRVFNDMQREFSLPPMSIYLDKKIPMGAGLGGGSSDAAFMMKALNEQFDLGLSVEEMKHRLSKIGADCAFFVENKPSFAMGIGDELSSVQVDLAGKWLVLLKPSSSVSTKEAYAHVPCRHASPVDLCQILGHPVQEWRNVVGNDFETSVFPTHPEIAVLKSALYDMHALYSSMSGSGSSVFGIFEHKPYGDLEKIFPDCFIFQSTLL